MTGRPWGVGVIGAGPVTQAIHLPVLATLADRFRVTHVMDVDADLAADVAARAGARHSTDVEALLADEDVDVVAICSPHAFHADQIEAVVKAAKRGILCEKPLATSVEQAERIAELSAAGGIPLVVGAMHAYDPAWIAATQAWGDLPERAELVRSRIYLPDNSEFVELATNVRAVAGRPAGAPLADAERLREAVLGLATHAVPQLRRFLPGDVRVVSARTLAPFGYHIVLSGDDRTAELIALMPGEWSPDWTFEVWAPGTQLTLDYPPSYVLAGSATATLRDESGSRSWSATRNGYQEEWRHLADIVDGRTEPAIPVTDAVADMVFTLQLADKAAKLLAKEG